MKSDYQAEKVLFELFFPEAAIDKIVTATNHYLRPMRPINRNELFKFLALTLRIGLNRCASRAENWQIQHPPFPSFGAIMTETRYEQILAAFHLCEFTDDDLKVRDAFLGSFGLTTGESMVARHRVREGLQREPDQGFHPV